MTLDSCLILYLFALQAQSEKINIFMKTLKEQGRAITEFDDALWCSMVDFVTIGRDYRSVTFKNGSEIKV